MPVSCFQSTACLHSCLVQGRKEALCGLLLREDLYPQVRGREMCWSQERAALTLFSERFLHIFFLILPCCAGKGPQEAQSSLLLIVVRTLPKDPSSSGLHIALPALLLQLPSPRRAGRAAKPCCAGLLTFFLPFMCVVF